MSDEEKFTDSDEYLQLEEDLHNLNEGKAVHRTAVCVNEQPHEPHRLTIEGQEFVCLGWPNKIPSHPSENHDCPLQNPHDAHVWSPVNGTTVHCTGRKTKDGTWSIVDEEGVSAGQAHDIRVTPNESVLFTNSGDPERRIVQEATPNNPKMPTKVPPGKTVQRWADNAMFKSPELSREGGPRVYLLSMTPDPLGTVAAVNHMYTGRPVRALSEITDEERRDHWQRVTKTRLKAPFEFVKFHFFIEGVTRAFTHQMVRQRTATYAQESLRFAVVEDSFADRVALPPSLAGTEPLGTGDNLALGTERDESTWQRNVWDQALGQVQEAYKHLVDSGMPAEDARGLLPTNVLTRLHYTTDLRALLDHAGNRLCTQAQFEWRLVWAQMIKAIREHTDLTFMDEHYYKARKDGNGNDVGHLRWQYEEIAGLFKPICYQTGKCEFMSPDDRTCSIRNRVQANHDIGRASDERWGVPYTDHTDPELSANPIVAGLGPQSVVRNSGNKPVFIGAIQPYEWLADPTAARKDGGGHLG